MLSRHLMRASIGGGGAGFGGFGVGGVVGGAASATSDVWRPNAANGNVETKIASKTSHAGGSGKRFVRRTDAAHAGQQARACLR